MVNSAIKGKRHRSRILYTSVAKYDYVYTHTQSIPEPQLAFDYHGHSCGQQLPLGATKQERVIFVSDSAVNYLS